MIYFTRDDQKKIEQMHLFAVELVDSRRGILGTVFAHNMGVAPDAETIKAWYLDNFDTATMVTPLTKIEAMAWWKTHHPDEQVIRLKDFTLAPTWEGDA